MGAAVLIALEPSGKTPLPARTINAITTSFWHLRLGALRLRLLGEFDQGFVIRKKWAQLILSRQGPILERNQGSPWRGLNLSAGNSFRRAVKDLSGFYRPTRSGRRIIGASHFWHRPCS